MKVAASSLVCLTMMLAAMNAGAGAAWYQNVTIKYVYAGQVGGRVAIKLNSTIDVGSCSPVSELALDPDGPYFWQMYSMIMTAYKSGSPINVFTDGACSAYGVQLRDVVLGTM